MTGFFIDILDGNEPVPPTLVQSDTNSLACNILSIVVANDKTRFLALYDVLSQRKPSRETEWIYNDYFIFSVLCAVKKFDLSPIWLREILTLRDTVTDEEKRNISFTFKNILAGNVNIRGDYHQVSIVYQYITKQEEYDEIRINKMFSHLWRSEFPFFDSTFLNLVSLKAVEIAFKCKLLVDPDKLNASNKFTHQFLQRTAKIANLTASILYLLIIALLIIATLYYSENKYIKGLLTVIALFGVGLSSYNGLKKKLAQYLTIKLRSLLGYDASA